MKKILMLSFLTVALISSVLFEPMVSAGESTQDNRGTVSLSYSTEKEVSPDTVEVSLAVKTSDKKLMQVAVSKNKEISNKVYDYLKANINTANGDYIKTSNYSAQPVYSWNNNKRELQRYDVSNNIILHTKSLDKIADLIDKSLELGATNVNSLNFTLSNKDDICVNLLSHASKQLRKRADAVVVSAGSAIVGVKTLNPSCSVNPVRNYSFSRNMMMAKTAVAEDAAGAAMETVQATNIEAGNIKLYASIDAIFFLR